MWREPLQMLEVWYVIQPSISSQYVIKWVRPLGACWSMLISSTLRLWKHVIYIGCRYLVRSKPPPLRVSVSVTLTVDVASQKKLGNENHLFDVMTSLSVQTMRTRPGFHTKPSKAKGLGTHGECITVYLVIIACGLYEKQ